MFTYKGWNPLLTMRDKTEREQEIIRCVNAIMWFQNSNASWIVLYFDLRFPISQITLAIHANLIVR